MPLDTKTSALVLDLYATGDLCIRDIAKRLNTNPTAVGKVLKNKGVSIRGGSSYRRAAIYTVNERYFEKIDTPEKAMILGFWFSDGNVYQREKRGSVSSVSQMANERSYIEGIRDRLGYNGPVRQYTGEEGRQYISLSIYHPQIANDLITLGCVPCKSLILKFPTDDQVPHHLKRDFIRGIFDGDGGFREGLVRKGYRSLGVGFGMSYDMAISFQTFMKNEGFHFTVHRAKKDREKELRGHMWHVVMNGNHQTIRFCKWLYRDAPFKMERKYQQYQNFLAYYEHYVSSGAVAKARKEALRGSYKQLLLAAPDGRILHSNCTLLFCRATKATFGLRATHVYRLRRKETPTYKGFRWATEEELASARESGNLTEILY